MIIERPDPTKITLQVTARNYNGTPKTLLTSARVRVYHLDSGGSEVEDRTPIDLDQVGSTNTWRYIWEPASLPVDQYFVEYTLIDPDAATFIDTEDLIIQDFSSQTDMVLLKQFAKGRWKLDEIENTMTYYDEDNVTPLVVFDTKDATGGAASENVYERYPRP